MHQGAGVLEGFHLFRKYNYIKGIFAISCLFMVEVTILDYTMKVLLARFLVDTMSGSFSTNVLWTPSLL